MRTVKWKKAKKMTKQEIAELIRRLRDIARIGIVNAKQDAQVLSQAADELEKRDERIDIMRECMDAGWGKEY